MQKMINRNGCFFDFALKRHLLILNVLRENMELDIFNKLNEAGCKNSTMGSIAE